MSRESDLKPASKGPWGIAALILAVAAGIVIAQFLPHDLFGLRGSGESTSAEHAHEDGDEQLWTCGMHPQVIQDEPGQCPICGMDLTPMRSEEEPAAEPTPAAEWTCPEHPMIVESEPGTCPIDGLDLVAVEPEPAAQPSGHSVRVASDVVQNMNVRTEPAVRRDLVRPIRTVGYLEFDQQRMVTVTTKYSGWIEKVYVNYVGEKVRRGAPLFEIYSPDLVQTEQELLSALRFADEMKDAPEDARQRALSMVESARVRLGYWDVSEEQIERLEETGEVSRTLEVRSPADGLVMKRLPGLEGMAVQPGMEIFHIADLSSLWLSVELFEDQMAWVREGTNAEISLSYFPGESFQGRVRFLEPELSDTTRTARAKIELPNPDGRLRKGMFATVELQPTAARDVVAVPTSAVLRTGRRDLVMVAEGNGRFTPREVTVGFESRGFTEIRQGLEEGTTVVTSAQFLLDSESKLRQAVRERVSGRSASQPADSANAPDHSGH